MKKEERAKVALIRQKIAEDTAFALRVFKVIWERQKPAEKFTMRHQGHDGKGFRESETYSLNALYEEIEEQGFRLSAYQADMVRERMQPYATQFYRASLEAKTSAPQKSTGGERVSIADGSGAGKTIGNSDVDSLRGVMGGMDDKEKLAAINRMAERMGV